MENQAPIYRLSAAKQLSFLRMLGLAARARKLAIGATIARDAMRTKHAFCAVLAEDGSENTRKRILDTAAYYGIPVYVLDCSSADLGHAIGKKGLVAALGVLDCSFASALQGIYDKTDLLEG